MTPNEIIESMCAIMPYEFRGRLSIEPYLVEAMELYAIQESNQAVRDCAESATAYIAQETVNGGKIAKVNQESILKNLKP